MHISLEYVNFASTMLFYFVEAVFTCCPYKEVRGSEKCQAAVSVQDVLALDLSMIRSV